jgi:2-C-methyl-D-erythritol 2,4-cyclodiphosphate synthase
MRVGIGYDIHALEKGRKLVLGGVEIPHEKGLVGHSDGDALFHAVIDAVLGALGKGDIGELFPDTDMANRGASSARFAEKVAEIVRLNRLKIENIDTVVIAEAPKLAPYKEAIRLSVAKAFGIDPSRVGVKAKTNEGFGEIGRGEAIACHAVASLTA